MPKARLSKAELAAALSITPQEVDRLIDTGILPGRGRRGWDLAECLRRLDLASTVDRIDTNPRWKRFISELMTLADEAPAALARAIADPTVPNFRAADRIGSRYFRAYAFAVNALDGRPGVAMALRPATFAATYTTFVDTLEKVRLALDAPVTATVH